MRTVAGGEEEEEEEDAHVSRCRLRLGCIYSLCGVIRLPVSVTVSAVFITMFSKGKLISVACAGAHHAHNRHVVQHLSSRSRGRVYVSSPLCT